MMLKLNHVCQMMQMLAAAVMFVAAVCVVPNIGAVPINSTKVYGYDQDAPLESIFNIQPDGSFVYR